MLNELDQRVGVLGHTMVGPSSEEEVLHLEGLGRWVSSLMGTRKYSEVWVQVLHKHMFFRFRGLDDEPDGNLIRYID